MKERFKKYIAFIAILIVLIYPILPTFVSVSYAEDSLEEIARQEEEARREAEADAQKQAQRESAQSAEAEHEAQEAQAELQEDAPPLPPEPSPTAVPSPTPTGSFINVDVTLDSGATSINQDAGANSTNDADATQTTTIDATNNNHDTSLDQSISVVSNTGDNVISGDPAPSPTPTPTPGPTPAALPGCEDRPPLSIEEPEQEATPSADLSAFLLFFIRPAFAQEDSSEPQEFTVEAGATNTDTGEFTESHATATDSDAIIASNKNCADLDDSTTAVATSGQNNASGNDGSVNVTTGDATASGTLENWGNTNTVELTSDGALAQNANTGDNSANFANAVEQDTILVDNTNFISADNELTVAAVSGENLLVDNEGANTLSTGNLELMAYLMNVLNMNITGKDFTHLIVNIFGNLTGEVDLDQIAQDLGIGDDLIMSVARNTDTGENSINDAQVLETTSVEVTNENIADVRNTVEVTGISGANDLTHGEDRILAYTGRIQILAAIMNFINSNFSGEDWYFAMVNVFGDLSGDITIPGTEEYLQGGAGVLAQNVNTGDGSTNDAEALLTSNITATNDNQANVINNVNALADSGSNVSYNADDTVFMETGTAHANGDILNWINYNLTGQNFVLLIVNVFGHWLGQVLAFPGQGDIDAPEDGTLVAIARGGGGPAGIAENVDTGAGSDNNVRFEHQFDVDAQNNNTANVENTINVTGISGQNTLSENEDPSWLATGWIDLNVGLLNIINFNVTGRNWMVLFVNVFGDFFGDVVFPGAAKTILAQGAVADITTIGSDIQEENSQENNQTDSQNTHTNTQTLRTNVILNTKKGGEIQNNKQDNILGTVPLAQDQDEDQNEGQDQDLDDFVIVSSNNDQTPKIPYTQEKFAVYGIMVLLTVAFLLTRRKTNSWENLPIPRIPLP